MNGSHDRFFHHERDRERAPLGLTTGSSGSGMVVHHHQPYHMVAPSAGGLRGARGGGGSGLGGGTTRDRRGGGFDMGGGGGRLSSYNNGGMMGFGGGGGGLGNYNDDQLLAVEHKTSPTRSDSMDSCGTSSTYNSLDSGSGSFHSQPGVQFQLHPTQEIKNTDEKPMDEKSMIRNMYADDKKMAPSSGPKTIEIFPGYSARLRGAWETYECIAKDFYLPTQCYGCDMRLFCIMDANFVVCPRCKVVGPLDGGADLDYNGGVGLGFTTEELQQWQYDIVRRRNQ